VEESREAIRDNKEQIADQEMELKLAIEDAQTKWAQIANNMIKIPFRHKK
jgi:hypothetical protein